ncbi:ETS-related transcription factor Elf-2 [Microtus ochrogaster]|uniref:ETS-related transcription factor Elf-2 n=1 Tax=Microtus ochrogaster TaxID=79684 RepID=A0A8J6KM28_MICOH|nr:ETS-related transcription factor Elf-2 [Microtus ochrogaster]
MVIIGDQENPSNSSASRPEGHSRPQVMDTEVNNSPDSGSSGPPDPTWGPERRGVFGTFPGCCHRDSNCGRHHRTPGSFLQQGVLSCCLPSAPEAKDGSGELGYGEYRAGEGGDKVPEFPAVIVEPVPSARLEQGYAAQVLVYDDETYMMQDVAEEQEVETENSETALGLLTAGCDESEELIGFSRDVTIQSLMFTLKYRDKK